MPGIIPPGKGISQLQRGYDKTVGGASAAGGTAPVQVSHATAGWNAANRALASSLPRSLFLAGQYQRATLLTLRKRSRIGR